MATYTKETKKDAATGKEVVRYKEGKKYVDGMEVPENVRSALNEVPEGTIVDELGDVFDPETDIDDGSGDEPAPKTADEDADLADDETDVDDDPVQKPQPKQPAAKPRARNKKNVDDGSGDEGMGFPRVNGVTVDLFDGKTPHTEVRNVSGFMVPLSHLSQFGDPKNDIAPKTDVEVIEKLKEIGKI